MSILSRFSDRVSSTPACAREVIDPGPLAPLLPGTDLSGFFKIQTGITPDPNWFAVYAVEPAGADLYLGLGTGRPADLNGALLARSDGLDIYPVQNLQEQGFIQMRYAGDTLYAPGVDPMEDWTLGNLYTASPPPDVIKHRTLPNVLHMWGVWPDPGASRVYAAVGQHAGDNATYFGGILISRDHAQSWTQVNDPKRVLGKYRTYDVVGLQNTLLATANDEYEHASVLARSDDEGATWKRVNVQVESRPRLVLVGDQVVAQRAGRGGLVLVDSRGKTSRTRFSGFVAADWAYNWMVVGDGSWCYMLADSGRIMRSQDLRDWSLVAQTGLTLTTIGYWPAKNWLIVGDRGAAASIWKLDLTALSGERHAGETSLAVPLVAPAGNGRGNGGGGRLADDAKSALRRRITTDLNVHGGRPALRDTDITAGQVLALLAAGASRQDVLDKFPALVGQDIQAALLFAAETLEARPGRG